MKRYHRFSALLLTIALLAGMTPVQRARAEESGSGTYIVFGVLTAALVAYGVMAYQADKGGDKPLEVPDQTGRASRKDGARLEVVPTPESNDASRPTEFGAGLALAARF